MPDRPHQHHPFGVAVMRLRGEAKVAQDSFAHAARFSIRTIVNWENGYRLPSRAQALVLIENLLASGYAADLLRDIADALNVAHLVAPPPEPAQPPPPPPPPPVVITPTLPSIDAVRRAVEHALYEAAEETDVPIRVARRVVVAVLDAMSEIGASAGQARTVVSREKTQSS